MEEYAVMFICPQLFHQFLYNSSYSWIFISWRIYFKFHACPPLCVCIGPFCVNGTPLRRVAQAYVISTKTKVDISTLNLPDTIDDAYFKRTKSDKNKKDGDIFSDAKKVSWPLALL